MPKVGEDVSGKITERKYVRKITPQQEKFLQNFLHKDMTQTAAARAAGYKHPNVQAVHLLRNPVVIERMEEMRQELEAKFGVSITKSVRDMQRLRDDAWQAGNFSAAIKAEELRLKATGLLVAKSHVVHENVDSMTKDDIMKQLQQFVEKAKSRMIDVTPDNNPEEPEQIPEISIAEKSEEVA